MLYVANKETEQELRADTWNVHATRQTLQRTLSYFHSYFVCQMETGARRHVDIASLPLQVHFSPGCVSLSGESVSLRAFTWQFHYRELSRWQKPEDAARATVRLIENRSARWMLGRSKAIARLPIRVFRARARNEPRSSFSHGKSFPTDECGPLRCGRESWRMFPLHLDSFSLLAVYTTALLYKQCLIIITTNCS